MDIVHEKDLQHFLFDSERTFRNLIENVHCGVYIADPQGELHYVNEALVDILGYAGKQELIGLNLARDLYLEPQQREVFLKAMEKTGFVRNYEVRNKRKDGSVVLLSATSHFIHNESGTVIGIEGIVLDITENKRLQEELLQEKNKLEQLLIFSERLGGIHRMDKLSDFVVEAVARIMNVRRCSLMMLDERKAELCIKAARGLNENYITRGRVRIGEGISGVVAREGTPLLVKNIEYDERFARKNRDSYLGRSFIVYPLKVDSRILGVVNLSDKNPDGHESFSELDLRILSVLIRQSAVALENVRMVKDLEHLANSDPLTNLQNYRGFVRSLEQELNRARRFSTMLSLMMLDIDNFKMFNDRFGHLEGDHLLKEVGRTLKETLRNIDSVCRYGGDEFVVILPGVEELKALRVAEKIRRAMEKVSAQEKLHISIGIAEYKPSLDRVDLISRVDRALYEAKRQGKDRIAAFSTLAAPAENHS